MTSLVGAKSARTTPRYWVVENHASRLRLGSMREEETKRGSPSVGSAAVPVAKARTAALYPDQTVTNFAVSTRWISVTMRSAPPTHPASERSEQRSHRTLGQSGGGASSASSARNTAEAPSRGVSTTIAVRK